MSLIRIIILFTCLIFSISVSGQDEPSTNNEYPKSIVLKGDTIMVFSMQQAIELGVRNERLKECNIDREYLNAQIAQMDTLNKQQESKIKDLYLVIDEERTQGKAKDVKIELHKSEKGDLKDEVTRQKTHKWIAIVAGTLATIIVAVLSN